jgi:hypothetical protein
MGEMTLVYSQIISPTGLSVESRTVYAALIVPQSWQIENPTTIIQNIIAQTDFSGTFSFNLVPQSQINIPNTYYRIWYLGASWTIVVPVSSVSLNIDTLVIDPSTLLPPVVPVENGYIASSLVGVAGGVVPLNSLGKIPSQYLPTTTYSPLAPPLFNFTFTQDSPSDTWNIINTLNRIPTSFVIFDTIGDQIEYESLQFNGTSSLTLSFSAPIAGIVTIG